MNRSILEMLRAEGYDTSKYDSDNPAVIKINEMLKNEHLGVYICDSKMVWVRKNGYQYNMKLLMCQDTNRIFIDRKRFVYMEKELNLYSVSNIIESFILNRYQEDYYRYHRKSYDIDNDSFSERNIMRDLERGEGEKHGFD